VLSRREKLLFHQIHPAKLATDIASGVASTWLMWVHCWELALPLAFIPSIVATAVIMRWADIEQLKDSAFGRYVARHMTALATAIRSAGQIAMWIAAWERSIALVITGAFVVVVGWTYSLVRRG
jgi:hypothetical protein